MSIIYQSNGADNALASNKTLIVPTVSMGNVAQLAVDLFINNLDFELLGRIDDQGLLHPFAGPQEGTQYNESEPDGICTSLEVFTSPKSYPDLVLIQQRSPPRGGCRTKFVDQILIPLVQNYNFQKLIVLSSCDASLRENANVTPFQTYSSDLADELRALVLSNQEPALPPPVPDLELLPESSHPQAGILPLSTHSPPSSLTPRMEGSGILLPLIKRISEAKPPFDHVSSKILVMYAFEGDNFSDARHMASRAASLIGIQGIGPDHTWNPPKSWQGVYGRPLRQGLEDGLYG